MSASAPQLLLVNPWLTDFAAYDFWMKPMGLLYLAALLRREGYAVRLVDCMDRSHPALLRWQGIDAPANRRWGTGKFVRTSIAKPAIYRSIPRFYARYGMPVDVFEALCKSGPIPDLILMTSGMTYWYPGVQETVRTLRRLYPNVPIVLGGIYATLCHQHAKDRTGADLVYSGEAESDIVSLVQDLSASRPVGSDDNHHGYVSSRRLTLDEIPFPAFDLYPKLHYATLMTSRGCPLRCTFCASRLVSGQYRWRSIENVMAEIEWLHQGLGVREFAFYDDALLTNRDRHFLPLCEQIIARKVSATFHTPNGLQVKFIDATTAELMWRAGFKTVRLAYESGSEERQRDMSKKVSNESFAAGVRHLQSAGFGPAELDAYVLMALPGQPLEETIRSMAYVHSLGVGIRLAAFSPIPGTVDYERAVARGEIEADTDPLLTNNSILPARLRHVPYEVYDRIARIAKQLNAHLLHRGQPMGSCEELARYTLSHLSVSEIPNLKHQIPNKSQTTISKLRIP